MVAALSLVDALVSKNSVLIGLLIVGPLVAATRGSRRGVVVVSAVAVVAAILLGISNDIFGTAGHLLRILIVGSGALLAVWTASIHESRDRTAALLSAQAAVARIIASSDTLPDATPKLLATIGERLDWKLGALWSANAATGTIGCVEAWAAPGADAERFLEATRSTVLRPGEGLPGRVWQSGRPAWVADVLQDENFPRSAAADDAGFHAALCFPINGSSGILGAIEFFASEPRDPDGHLLDLMQALGVQVGEYIERKSAEDAVVQSEARKTAVVQAALDSIITMDREGRVVEFNPAAERTFGYSADEVLGGELAELIVPAEFRERHRQGLARYLETGEGPVLDRRVEMRAMRKDGSEFPVELTITAIPVDPPMFTGYVRDITERREAEAVQQRLAAIVESSDDAILSKDRNLIVTSWNAAAERLYGYTIEEAVGMPIARIIPRHRKGEESDILNQVIEKGKVEHYETERVRKDGTQVDVSLTVSPLLDDDGEVVGASVIARDITERKRVDAQRAELLRIEQETRRRVQRAERRASFLAEAQALLSSSLDFELTLRNLAKLSVPALADWCAVDIVAPDGSLERLATVHSESISDGPDGSDEGCTPDFVAATLQDDERGRLLSGLGGRSGMIVPLLARERALGAITFVAADPERAYDAEDLALAEDLAARAAIAADNARLYGERSYIASTLQQSLMPENLPDIPGVELAARYYAAGEGNEVGGDFYDIYRSGEKTWGIAIGDVRGKGPRAAAVTSLARYTMRTASLTETRPSRVLEILNEALLRERATDRFCTVAYASIAPNGRSGVEMTIGIGGHPLPLLLRADGSVETVGSPGTLIGLVSDPDIVDQTVDLGPSDSLVLYTDGVPEARSELGLFGEDRLVDLLKSCAGLDPAAIAERIEQDVLSFQHGSARDDLAVLVLRVRGEAKFTGVLETGRFESTARRAPA